MFGDARTHEFLVFQACERFGILPPGAEPRWDDMEAWNQALLLAYEQTRQFDELEAERRNQIRL